LQRPASAGNIVSAHPLAPYARTGVPWYGLSRTVPGGVTSDQGQQATVRGKMRREQVDSEEDQESNAKPDRKAFWHFHLPTILKD